MSNRERVVAALNSCFDDFHALVGSLGDADWGVQSLCPEWTVRGVVEHLAGIEVVMTDWLPESTETPIPFDRMVTFQTEAAEWSPEVLTAKVGEVLAVRRLELAELTDAQFDSPALTPVGPATYASFLGIRVFDFWVHQRDMAIPLGTLDAWTAGGDKAEIAMDEVNKSLGYIAGKKIGLPDGKSMTISTHGGVTRDMHVAVDGRASIVDSLSDPDVVLEADSTAFIMLACGRVDPQEQIDAGNITWSGDDELGEKAARNLRFTM